MFSTRHNTNLALVQHKKEVDGDYGVSAQWEEFRRVWVSINPDRGREFYSGDEKQSRVTHTIRGDYLELKDVTDEMRFVYNAAHEYDAIEGASKVFNILAVMTDFDHKGDVMVKVELNNIPFSKISPSSRQ